MNVLLISDNPETKTFYQVVSLKRQIQECSADVDLLTFSDSCISFNGKTMGKDSASEILQILLKRKPYDVITITLELSNLKSFLEKNLLSILRNHTRHPSIFVFGASSLLSKMGKDNGVHLLLYSRRGVAKFTHEFRNDVIDYIKRECKLKP